MIINPNKHQIQQEERGNKSPIVSAATAEITKIIYGWLAEALLLQRSK